MTTSDGKWKRIKHAMRHAFAVGPDERERTPEQEAIIEKLATKIVERQLTAPAIMFLESIKPASFIGTQLMAFLDPFARAVFNYEQLDAYRKTFEDRRNVEELIKKIEELDSEYKARRKKPSQGEESQHDEETR